MDPSLPSLDLPAGVDEAHAARLARAHAPSVRLHDEERHLPGDPDRFRACSRFRWSRSWPRRDAGWRKTEPPGWVDGNDQAPAYYDVAWGAIAGESRRRYGAPGNPFDPDQEENLRPRDGGNRDGGSNGVFLERDGRLPEHESGLPCDDTRGGSRAHMFYDVYADRDHDLVRVLYWTFYELNWWGPFLTHQGDWEHVSWLYATSSYREGREPEWAYFAQHDGGVVYRFAQLRRDPVEPLHREIFVDPYGHPSDAAPKSPHAYLRRWRPWLQDLIGVPSSEWRDFAGAWGAVGLTAFTTGPLGPRFKRRQDLLRGRYDRKGRFVIRFKVPR